MGDQENPNIQLVEQLYSKNWNRFQDWAAQGNNKLKLNLPQDVAQAFIPRRLLELSINPEKLRVVTYQADEGYLGFVVCEDVGTGLSDKMVLEDYMDARGKNAAVPLSQGDVPPGIDYMHVSNFDLIKNGNIGLNDKVYLRCALSALYKAFPKVVMTVTYQDRSEMQGKGIGSSFFDTRDSMLKALGFKYNVGHITSPHPEFFKKRGGLDYSELPEEMRSEIPARVASGPLGKSALIKPL